MTADRVHYGQAAEVYAARQVILDRAFKINPKCFVNKPSKPPEMPIAIWTNPPNDKLKIRA